MRTYLYWPFAREEDTHAFRAIPGSGDSLLLHTLAREGVPTGSSSQFVVRNDLPAVSVAEPGSLRWAVSRASTYARRVGTRRRALAADEFDVAHIAFVNLFTDAVDLRRIRRRLPLVTTVHDVVPHIRRLPSQLQHATLERLYDGCGTIVVHHEAVATELIERFRVERDRLTVVPLWVTPIWTNERARSISDRPIVLFLGSLRPNKGIDVLIDAAERVGPAVRFHVAGRGDSAVEQRLSVATRRNAHLTAEIGWVSPARKHQLYLQADLVVLPYTSFSSQSAVLHDAYGAHLPVVATDVGALGPSVRAAGTGRVVEASDSEQLAAAIVGLLSDDGEWQAASAAAARVARVQSPEAFGRSLRAVYRQLVS